MALAMFFGKFSGQSTYFVRIFRRVVKHCKNLHNLYANYSCLISFLPLGSGEMVSLLSKYLSEISSYKIYSCLKCNFNKIKVILKDEKITQKWFRTCQHQKGNVVKVSEKTHKEQKFCPKNQKCLERQNTCINNSQRSPQHYIKCSQPEPGQVALNEFGEYFYKYQMCLVSERHQHKGTHIKAIIPTYVPNVDIYTKSNEFQGQCSSFGHYV